MHTNTNITYNTQLVTVKTRLCLFILQLQEQSVTAATSSTAVPDATIRTATLPAKEINPNVSDMCTYITPSNILV